MFTASRPLLKPMRYTLFMPHRGVYVKALRASQGTFQATGNAAEACALPDPEARAAGRRVIEAMGEPVELRPVDQSAGQAL